MRLRRHIPTKEPRSKDAPPGAGRSGRRWLRLRDVAIIAGVFAVGYVIAALWIAPTPNLGARDRSLPRVLGLTEADARQALIAADFKPRISGSRPHPTQPARVVIWQDPPPGVVLSPNSTVMLVLSAGPSPVPVPDVIGLDTATARRILTAAGVRVGDIALVTGRQEPGIVVGTRPVIGATRPRGAAVGLVVSRGQEESP